MGLQTVVYDCQVTCIFFMTGGFYLCIMHYLKLWIYEKFMSIEIQRENLVLRRRLNEYEDIACR